MNICGCLVHVAPDQTETVAAQMAKTAGTEIHAQSEDGRFVIVVEDTPQMQASETIMQLHQLPGVVSLTLTYHHFEDPTAAKRPADFQTGDQCNDHF